MTLGYRFSGIAVYDHLKACAELDRQLERQHREKMQKARLRMAQGQAGLAGVDIPGLSEFRAHYQVDKQNQGAFDLCHRLYMAALNGKEFKSGVTLHGDYGCGKTTLVLSLCRSLLELGIVLQFVNVPDELERLKGLMKSGGLADRIDTLASAQVLVLDDLGRERCSAWTVDQVMYPLIDHRYRAGLPTLCTTNETVHSLREKYETPRGADGEIALSAGAVVDRLRERSPWIPVGGESRRKPQLDF